jgi:membrane protease YdiL (CAAX protease family)
LDFRLFAAFLSEWLGAFSLTWLLSLSPRLQKPILGFKYARRDGIMALSLYSVILAFAFVFYIFTPPIFPEPLRIAAAPVHDLLQALLVAAICLLPFIASILLRKQPVRSLGWDMGLLRPALQMGFAIAIMTIFLRNHVMTILGGLPPERLNPLLLAMGIAILEETIFRGYIQPRLAWWLGPVPGIALTAALSTLWHLPVWLNWLPGETILILVGLTFVQALVLGWIMRKAGHVAAPAFYRAFSIWMQFLG